MQKLATEPLATDSHRHEYELLRLCARTTIDSQTREKISLLLDAEIDWDFFVETAHDHRVLPLIYRTLADAYTDRTPAYAMERLRKAFYANARRNLFLTSELFQVLTAFERHNIPVIPYKGPILAAALYGEVSLREFSDLDVIVPKDCVERATALLIDRGYKMTRAEKEKDLLLVRDDAGINFELHWGITVEKDPLQVNPEILWENLDTLSVAGKTVTIHAPEDLLLILSIHGGKHRWEHLGWLCDVAEIIRRYPQLDWEKLIHRASTLGARRILLVGLLLSQDLLGAQLSDVVIREIQSDHVVVDLADQVQRSLTSETPVAAGETEQYYMRLRERPVDKARVAVNQVKHHLMPTRRDREVLPFRGPLSGLLYVARPFRLAWEYGLGPFWRFFKGTLESGSSKKHV
jgi:hypothetical protein